MNEFEKRISALRIQYKNERKQIQKDSNRTIGRLNTAIGMVNTPEAREALRTQKARVYENTRQSMKYNRYCYKQLLKMIEDEYMNSLREKPSKKQLRNLMSFLYKTAEAEGQTSIRISFGDHRLGTVTFS